MFLGELNMFISAMWPRTSTQTVGFFHVVILPPSEAQRDYPQGSLPLKTSQVAICSEWSRSKKLPNKHIQVCLVVII